MGKQVWKPGNMVYPVPAVLVSAADGEGRTNLITVAWTGTICTNPPMAYISVRPERYSYGIIRDTDKFRKTRLTAQPASFVKAPLIAESPVNLECRVEKTEELGSHHMFLAKVLAVHADEAYLDAKGRLDLERAGLLAYSHGNYLGLGQKVGTFGYSVKKAGTRPRGRRTAVPKKSGGQTRHP